MDVFGGEEVADLISGEEDVTKMLWQELSEILGLMGKRRVLVLLVDKNGSTGDDYSFDVEADGRGSWSLVLELDEWRGVL